MSRRAANPEPAAIRLASSVSIADAQNGRVSLRLHDRGGAIFAAAILPREMAVDASGQILDILEGREAAAEGRA